MTFAPPTSTERNGRRPSHGRRLAVSLVTAGFMSIAALLYTMAYFGSVTGEEFSPDVFTRRRFTYFEIPLLEIQISPIKHDDCTNPLESYLAGEKLVPPARMPSASRWDLVRACRGTLRDPSMATEWGDARILCSYLDAVDADGHHFWLDWTKSHRQHAVVLWPQVAKLGRHELYFLAPELLALALGQEDATQLRQEIGETLTQRFLQLARCQQQLGRHQEAVALFTYSLERTPRNLDALAGRANSWAALGKQELAAADLAELKKIHLAP